MIRITIFRNQRQEFMGFEFMGHAGYANEGEDIVCAGVSALAINTVNTLGTFTSQKFSTDSEEESGTLIVRFDSPANHDADLMMKSMVLGLQGIQNNYGNEFLVLNFEEV